MSFQFYGLHEQPFGVTPNPRFLYRSPGHLEVLASLIYAIENDLGMSVVTAEPGLGKTTLLYYLLEKYQPSSRTALLFQTQCTGVELLRLLAAEFDEPYSMDPVLVYEQLKKVLAKEARVGKRVLLVVDEAQNLDVSTLETVRLLSNFETRERKLIHIVLAGQQQLADRLRQPELSQLLQRFTIINQLRPLDLKETSEYVAHRLRVAGASGEVTNVFSGTALRRIAEGSRGIPRDINRVCFNALSAGYALQRKVIGPDVIDEVLQDLDLTVPQAGQEVRARVPDTDAAQHKKDPNWDIERWFSNESRQGRPVEFSPKPAANESPVPLSSAMAGVASGAADGPALSGAAVASGPRLEPKHAESEPPAGVSHQVQGNLAYAAKPTRVTESDPFEVSRPQLVPDNGQSKSRPLALYASVLAVLMLLAMVSIFAWTRHVAAAPAPSNHGVESAATRPVEPEIELPQTVAETSATKPRNSKAPKQKPAPTRQPEPKAVTADSIPVRKINLAAGEQSQSDPQEPAPLFIAGSSTSTAAAMKDVVTSVARPVLPPPRVASYTRAELLHMVKPVYPLSAKRASIEGAVVLRLIVAKDGTVSKAIVVAGNELLATAALDAVKQWRYRPARMNGQPTEDSAEVTIYFHVDSKPS